MCVCVCVCVCAWCVHTQSPVFELMCIYMHMKMYVYIYVHTFACVCAYTCICECTHIPLCACLQSQRLTEVRKEEYELLEAQSIPLRNYLMQHVMPTLTQSLIDCCKARPEDPIDYIVSFLTLMCILLVAE